MFRKAALQFILFLLFPGFGFSAGIETKVSVDFGKELQDWDGFGVNYVETCQTRDYAKQPQDYGGFSRLNEVKRQQILQQIFGEDGLKPGLVKMFLDPFHEGMTDSENDNEDPFIIDPSRFDHKTTTKWMRYFVREGLALTRARGADLSIITTLYGPPAWCTKQKFIRGRDLDPVKKYEIAEYITAWLRYLRFEEKFPVNFVSLHNEGEDFIRWPVDGKDAGWEGHDYNLYWPPPQVAEFIPLLREMLDKQELGTVGVSPGETTSWDRFVEWGYAFAIANDPKAAGNLGLITSHGFLGASGRWYGTHNKLGIDLLHLQRPELHAWTTSISWGKMDVSFLTDLLGQIYTAGVNGCIPWACIQSSAWKGGDPNPGCAFFVNDNGEVVTRAGYYYYKQITRAGQPGMKVAAVSSSDESIKLAAFARNKTKNPDAFLLVNTSATERKLDISIKNCSAVQFDAYRTSGNEMYQPIGSFSPEKDTLQLNAPPLSVTTFYGK